MNKLQSSSISILLATTLASHQAYSYSIYDEKFGIEGAEKIKAGYYYVMQDTVFFKMKYVKKVAPLTGDMKITTINPSRQVNDFTSYLLTIPPLLIYAQKAAINYTSN